MNRLFNRTSILLPSDSVDLEKWSVIACDQHSSEPEYWEALSAYVGDAPSTLHLMLPEAYLDRSIEEESKKINATMQSYLSSGIFQKLENCYVYVERILPSGIVRRGLVGALELAEYDYSKDSTALIRATEGTVEARLPARVKIRSGAALEMPHVMVFADDPDNLLFENIDRSHRLYDFDLSADGGHITGWLITGEAADRIDAAMAALEQQATEKFSGLSPAVLAIGDGNHSLATAKKCGDAQALVEIVNIEDESITFEPIHRVLFHTDTAEFLEKYGEHIARAENSDNYAQLVAETEAWCQDYIARNGGSIDYIHNDETAIEMGQREGCAAILLPALDKTRLFESIVKNGPFPKKSFSIGHACDKRYYLECREI